MRGQHAKPRVSCSPHVGPEPLQNKTQVLSWCICLHYIHLTHARSDFFLDPYITLRAYAIVCLSPLQADAPMYTSHGATYPTCLARTTPPFRTSCPEGGGSVGMSGSGSESVSCRLVRLRISWLKQWRISSLGSKSQRSKTRKPTDFSPFGQIESSF
jgi:hypothetical protein